MVRTLEDSNFINASSITPSEGGASLVVAWRLKQKKVLIVGGGDVASGRVFYALDADAFPVTVVCPSEGLDPTLRQRIFVTDKDQIEYHDRKFEWDDLNDKDLVMTAIDEHELSVQIGEKCRELKIPVNVADVPPLCDFYFMSTFRDQSLQVAVSTNGNGPKLANVVRRLIQTTLPKESGTAITRVGHLRKSIRAVDNDMKNSAKRMRWVSKICVDWSLKELGSMSNEDVQKLVEIYLSGENSPQSLAHLHCLMKDESLDQEWPGLEVTEERVSPGKVFLVGAGPGDPELLTMKAHNLLKSVDVVLTDKLVSKDILELIPRSVEIKSAGKYPGRADKAQTELNEWGLGFVKAGKDVVRLKNGDPFVFGRGGEEILFYREHGIEPEVVPGISSSLAAPLTANIPVTHRGVATQFLVSTGRGRNGLVPDLPMYDSNRTLVLLMGIERIQELSEKLQNVYDYPALTPVACVQKACFVEDERVVVGTLDNIAEKAGENQLVSPTTIIVGQVVAVLHHDDFPKIGADGQLVVSKASPVIHDITHIQYNQEDVKQERASSSASSVSDSDYISSSSIEDEKQVQTLPHLTLSEKLSNISKSFRSFKLF
eukprot:Nk52_evm58s210 gene=Nk52_evmTU58s210